MEKDTLKIDDTVLWISGGILLLAGIGTGVYFYLKKKKESNKMTSSNHSGAAASSGFCKYGDDFPLRHSSCGKNVMVLQKILHSLGADLGTGGKNKDGVDGKYGNKTQAGVRKYLNKLTVSLTDFNRLKRM